MPRIFRLTLLLVVSSSLLFSQVIIREKVEVNPSPKVFLSTQLSPQPHQEITITFTWSPSIFGRIFILWGACLQGSTEGYGSITLRGPATPPGYAFDVQLRTAELGGGQILTSHFKATVGTTTLMDVANPPFEHLGIFSRWLMEFPYLGSYYSRFDVFSEADSIYAGEATTFKAYGGIDCLGTLWHPADSIHFTVTSGTDLGTFVDKNNVPLGQEFTRLAADLWPNQNVRFIANGPMATLGGVIKLQGTSGEVTSTVSFVVKPTTLKLIARFPPTEVYYGGEAYIRVQTARPDGVFTPPAKSVTYTYTIIEGNESGFFFRGAAEADTLANLPQFNGDGILGFRAREQEVLEPKTVKVKVTASDATIAPLIAEFKVVPSPLLVKFTPSTVRYGDTVKVDVLRKLTDSTGIPLAADAWLDYQIFRGVNTGTLATFDGRKSGDYISGSYPTARFLAIEESPQPDSIEMRIVVNVYSEGSAPSGLRLPLSGVGRIRVLKKGLNFTYFTQGDRAWANLLYDNSKTEKIGKKGCALTAMAMVLKAFGVNVDPGSLNEWMKNNNGFSGLRVRWQSINDFPGNDKTMFSFQEGEGLNFDEATKKLIVPIPINLSDMDASLNKGLPVLAQVLNPTTNRNHWVLVTGKQSGEYKILDPGGYPNRTTLSRDYKNLVYKFIVYKPK